MHLLMRESELMEQLIQASEPQVNAPLLLDHALRAPRGPLIAVDPIIGRGLVQHDVFQNLALRG